MEIEQIISLLQICGYILFLPAGGFLVGTVVSILRLRNCPPDEPVPATAPIDQSDPALQTISEAGDRPRKRPQMRKKETKPAVQEISVKQPVVTAVIPSSAQQTIAALWSKFSEIPATWRNLNVEEELE